MNLPDSQHAGEGVVQVIEQGRRREGGQVDFLPVREVGLDLKRFAPAGPPQTPPTFLFIGRLLGDKGVVEFAQAAGED